MRELGHESLIEYLVEESYEVIEAVERALPPEELRGELGDVLLQVVLHARIAEEAGAFAISDVVDGLAAKMMRRNPHVFRADGSLQEEFPATVDEIVVTWHQVKATENPGRGVFEGIPAALPALALAQKSLRKVAVAAVVPGEVISTEAGLAEAGLAEDQLGEQLFELLRANPDVDAERALRKAVRRFQHEHELKAEQHRRP